MIRKGIRSALKMKEGTNEGLFSKRRKSTPVRKYNAEIILFFKIYLFCLIVLTHPRRVLKKPFSLFLPLNPPGGTYLFLEC